MAKIYSKTTSDTLGVDKCLILDPKEALIYPFNLGNWTEIRVGVYTSVVSLTDDNGNPSDETASNAQLMWGLKDSSTNLPGTAGSIFWGWNMGPNATVSYVASTGATNTSIGAALWDGATSIVGSANTVGLNLGNAGATSASGTVGYASLNAWRYILTNRGLSNQTVTMTTGRTNSTTHTNTTLGAIRAFLNSASITAQSVSNGAWNTGTAAKPIPDAFFIRSPFVNNRIRVHSILIERYA